MAAATNREIEALTNCITEWFDRCIHWQFYGEVSLDQLIETYGQLYGHESFDSTRAQIRNFRDVSVSAPSVEDVQTIAAFDRAAALSNPIMKVAVVTPDCAEHKMLAELYSAELYESPWDVKVFDCLEQAKRWIGAN